MKTNTINYVDTRTKEQCDMYLHAWAYDIVHQSRRNPYLAQLSSIGFAKPDEPTLYVLTNTRRCRKNGGQLSATGVASRNNMIGREPEKLIGNSKDVMRNFNCGSLKMGGLNWSEDQKLVLTKYYYHRESHGRIKQYLYNVKKDRVDAVDEIVDKALKKSIENIVNRSLARARKCFQ